MVADDSEGRERRNNNGTKDTMVMAGNGEEPICRTLSEVQQRKEMKNWEAGLGEFNGRNGGRKTDRLNSLTKKVGRRNRAVYGGTWGIGSGYYQLQDKFKEKEIFMQGLKRRGMISLFTSGIVDKTLNMCYKFGCIFLAFTLHSIGSLLLELLHCLKN